ncbi:hypothetical protein BDM02DRAFT_3183684 [Thelephora ganbajun]|uniref:Uncharacterized protein n=1 Tax=Thelephora ganbajun TaxID=370292 RepID=A0ACB6ZRQ8_THEGA|nr:hypothetical protein BDM02DRAFT_3183684 [Thelephora ganbajun]
MDDQPQATSNRKRDALFPISTSPESLNTPRTPRRRYPTHLSQRHDPDRVPLHRRGTSNTYERMEDLLTEAGYKETRVFTPEAERFPADGDKRKGDAEGGGLSVKESVGAVVGFLAGLVPGQSKQNMGTPPSTDLVVNDQEVYLGRPHPPSPLAHKVEQSPSNSNSLRSKKFTIAPSNQRPTSADPETSSGSSGDPHQSHTILGDTNPNSDQRSLRSQLSVARLQPSQSAAYNYLRHMVSTPSIQRRSSDEDASVVNLTERVHPPLPIAWRENVIAAMNMKGSVSTGGITERHRALSRPKSRRTLEANDNGKNTYEQTDERRGRTTTRERSSLAPPQIHTPRLASPGAVAMINVTCKSAPGSRSASIVRGTFKGGLLDISQLDQAFRDKGKAVRRPSRRIRSQVPSLIVTGVEGDDWGGANSEGGNTPFSKKQELDYDEDDDDEGELDLAKMLLHPKRQQSIQSLRRHLQRHTSLSQRGRLFFASTRQIFLVEAECEEKGQDSE